MPSIQGTKPVVVPPSSVFRERRQYLSPDRRWTVIYHTPREWHMGADGWRVRLLHKGRHFWARHGGLARLSGAKGFRCEEDQQPWSRDSKALVFLTWDEEPVHIYDVETKVLRQVHCGSDFVYSVQWSPGVDRLLVTFATGAVLTDQGGVRRGSAGWSIAPHERPHTHWTKDGNWFFVLARQLASEKVTLAFYAGEDGTVGEAYELDPIDLVPYDAERFADLPRDRFCLVVTARMGAVGLLLDTWHGVQFDQPSSTLFLAVYRPVSPVYKVNGESLCHVEEQWVAVELGT